MISRRELLIRSVMGCCQTAVTPATVLRQPTTAIARDQTPVLVMAIVSDAPVKRSNDRMERELVVRLTSYVRDPTDGFAVADDLLCKAHLALLVDPTLGGLALSLTEMEADYQAEDADVEAIAIPAIYRITYRTLVSDISQGG
ncbi:MAG TPA: hypothetical protein PKM96_09135 [Accumulibacter sp.]|nr:hypothetical protein [Accumulibacter sp.]